MSSVHIIDVHKCTLLHITSDLMIMLSICNKQCECECKCKHIYHFRMSQSLINGSLQWVVHSVSGPALICLSLLYIEEEPPPPRSIPWGAYRCTISCGAVPPSICLQNYTFTHFHTVTHSYLVGRSMMVGHILMAHTCSLMCTNHIDMIAHTLAF